MNFIFNLVNTNCNKIIRFIDFAEFTGSGHILGSNSENSNLLPVAVE